jgi:hypothetical protein
MADLTLVIDDAVLKRAREEALRTNTSLNALVQDFLHRYVDARSRRLKALAQFEAVASSSESRSDGPWSRASLHERS